MITILKMTKLGYFLLMLNSNSKLNMTNNIVLSDVIPHYSLDLVQDVIFPFIIINILAVTIHIIWVHHTNCLKV